jgi:hypothetical protein
MGQREVGIDPHRLFQLFQPALERGPARPGQRRPSGDVELARLRVCTQPARERAAIFRLRGRHIRDEAIAPPGLRDDEAIVGRPLAQRLADGGDAFGEAVILDRDALPDDAHQLRLGHECAGARRQIEQGLQRPTGERAGQAGRAPDEPPPPEIEQEIAERQILGRSGLHSDFRVFHITGRR